GPVLPTILLLTLILYIHRCSWYYLNVFMIFMELKKCFIGYAIAQHVTQNNTLFVAYFYKKNLPVISFNSTPNLAFI
ncbi:MAG: hypothetical protein ABJA71_14795, partial [Ginsengibacter sp.]